MAAPILKAYFKRSRYKTVDKFLDSVYKKNKTYIDNHIDKELLAKYGDRKGKEKYIFKGLIMDKMKDINFKTGRYYTVTQAIKRVANSMELNRGFEKGDVARANFEYLIKKDKKLMRKFIRLTTPGEKKLSYDYKKLQFQGYYNINGTNASVYQYDEDFYIIEEKSPHEGVGSSTYIIPKDEFDMRDGKDIHFTMWSHRRR